jgi:hypothetical protein
MSITIDAARTRAHLSRRERQRLARTWAFSRRTGASPPASPVITFEPTELELIEQLVHHGRTAVSSALLAVAGIGAGELRRRAVLAEVDRTAGTAQSRGAISPRRAAQIARHVQAALAAA